MTIEKRNITLGYIPLTDCAPLVVAKELGFFGEESLRVSLSREASWATIRDKVAMGRLDGAQMIAGMPIATRLGICAVNEPMLTAFSMGLNGNAVTVSNELYERMRQLKSDEPFKREDALVLLKALIEQGKEANRAPLKFAVVFPVSSHNYQLRYWLASADIDPDNDIHISVIPPPQMVETLKQGVIDGFCVGEPWNTQAIELGIGHTLITGYEIWNNAPEKVFGVTQQWADANPQTHQAILRALLKAAAWLDEAENRQQAATLLTEKGYINLPESVINASLQGMLLKDIRDEGRQDLHVFYRYTANYPWVSHAVWFICQMYRWGQVHQPIDIYAAASAAYRPDIFRQAIKGLDYRTPRIDMKPEGQHPDAWQLTDHQQSIPMGADRFIDQQVFQPASPLEYLQRFSIEHIALPLDQLVAAQGQV